MAHVLILGAGFGGIAAATALAAGGRHAVTLVDRRETFMMGLAKLWALVGMRGLAEGERRLDRLAAPGVRFVRADIERIDPATRRVRTTAGEFAGDALLIALGAETDPGAIPGLPPEANLFDPGTIAALHGRLAALRGGRVAVVICRAPYKCPPSPFEAALLLQAWFAERGLRGAVEIAVYVPEERPLMVAGPAAGEQVRRYVESRGVAVRTNHKLARVGDGGRTLEFEHGAREAADVALVIPPHVVPRCVRESGLTDATGWIPADPATLATAHPLVHAIGDVAGVKLPGGGLLPKAGLFAERQGRVAAARIAAALEGRAPDESFDGEGTCWFETGGGEAMTVHGRFFGDPAGRVTIGEASAAAFREKQRFESERLAAWFA